MAKAKTKEINTTGGRGANQYQIDPRQAEFLALYLSPDSQTYMNAYQSALAVGYSVEYAKTILNKGQSWIAESVRDAERLAKAESVLDESMNLDTLNEEGRTDPALQKIKLDASKFVAKGLGKHKYAERREFTGANGGAIEHAHITELKDSDLYKVAYEIDESGNTTASESGAST